MKSFHYLSLLFFLAEEISNVRALPAGTVSQTLDTVGDALPVGANVEIDTKRDDSELEESINKLLAKLVPGASVKRSVLNEAGETITNTVSDTIDGVKLGRDYSPLAEVGEAVGSLRPVAEDVLPSGNDLIDRDGSPLAEVGEVVGSLRPLVEDILPAGDDLIPLNAFKKRGKRGLDDVGEIAGHALPTDILEALKKRLPTAEHEKNKRATFDPEKQRIDVTGDHVFVPPDFENGDVRGPCPGLNVLANHGYLPHNGVATIPEYIYGVNSIFGMGLDISTVLAVYGTVEGGNPLSLTPGFSMGGESDASENILGNLGGLLGTPRGLAGTHNQYEEDGSGTRGDLYDPIGDNNNLNMSYFLDLYNLQKDAEEPDYSMEVIGQHNLQRFEQSIANNPYFFYGPSAGLVVRNAAYAFTGRLFPNSSAEHPEGVLNKETLKSFFGVYGDENNLTYKVGWERFPDNWYRRDGDYTFVSYGLDLVQWVTKYPRLLTIGGNTGTVNSFTGIDIGNLTGGLMNTETLLENNNLLCFGLEFLKEFTPNSLSTLFKTIATPLQLVLDVLDSTLLSLECPDFKDLGIGGTDFTEYLKSTYPGVAKSGGAV